MVRLPRPGLYVAAICWMFAAPENRSEDPRTLRLRRDAVSKCLPTLGIQIQALRSTRSVHTSSSSFKRRVTNIHTFTVLVRCAKFLRMSCCGQYCLACLTIHKEIRTRQSTMLGRYLPHFHRSRGSRSETSKDVGRARAGIPRRKRLGLANSNSRTSGFDSAVSSLRGGSCMKRAY